MIKPFDSTFLSFLLYRLSSVLIIQTSYVPDEYWQSLEVAHNTVFGYGYLTWEWKHGLRSSFYPFLFAVLYQILKVTHLDFPNNIIYLPKILQAVVTAVSDRYFFLLCTNFNFDVYWAKLVIFSNWFWFYCGTRTLINTFETCLTTIALYYYPWTFFYQVRKEHKRFPIFSPEVKSKSLKYLSLAAINCIVRPTALTIWAPLVFFQLKFMHRKFLKEFVFTCILPVVLSVLPISLALDYLWYGKFIIPALNFFLFNISEGVASFYGTHPFYWYFIQGLPVVLGLHYISFIVGFVTVLKDWYIKLEYLHKNIFNIIISTLIFNLLLLSCVPHKEFRFILPLTPMMMILVVKISTEIFTNERKTYKLLWSICLIMGFLVPTFVFGSLHQRGTLNLTDYLRNSTSKCNSDCSYLYLMPCHSAPLYSHLHVNVSTRFLTCEPPIAGNKYDESEDFFANPNSWLEKNWDDIKRPTHVAFFDTIEKSISSFLTEKGFVKTKKFLQTMFAEKNLGRFIFVYEPS